MRALVTQRESVGAHGGAIDSLEREYVDFLAGMVFDVFPLSAFAHDVASIVAAVQPDLVVLTGGGIVQADAYRYDVEGWHQRERDAVEDELVRIALGAGVPIVGICRGMHKLNAFFGGKVSAFDGLAVPRAVREMHPVELVGTGERFEVNNFHRDGLFPHDLGDGLRAVALDPQNGTVEAFAHVEHGVLGIQWHPERMAAGEAAREWAKARVLQMIERARTL